MAHVFSLTTLTTASCWPFQAMFRPSVILLRLPRANAAPIFRPITGEWREIEESLTSGAIVVMEESAARIRRLAIASGDCPPSARRALAAGVNAPKLGVRYQRREGWRE